MSARLPLALRALVDLPDDERRLGPFLLVRMLGHGGFAPVWLAKEIYRGTEVREVAVKLFLTRARERALDARPLGTPGAGEALSTRSRKEAAEQDPVVEEARALCRVEHPNVVRFYQLLIDDERSLVGLVMEYVKGSALDRRLDDEKLSVSDALVVGIAVASALAAVHAAGLVHRDVKPANVIESGGVYKLIDFGIAAADAPRKSKSAPKRIVVDDLPLEALGTKMSVIVDPDAETEASSSSASGAILSSGTVGYMDPACVESGAAATPASDLYSLGALLFECLTGKLPAVAAMTGGGGMKGEVLDGRAQAPALSTIDPSLPPALAAIVDALLEPKRDARPPSATAALDDLRAVQRALSPSADAPPPSEPVVPTKPSPVAPSARRRRGVVGALVVALGVALAGGIAWDRACVHVSYCATTVERRGVYECVAEVPSPAKRSETRRFSARGGHVLEVAVVNGLGLAKDDGGPTNSVTTRYLYDDQGRVSRRIAEDLSGQIAFQFAYSWRADTLQVLRLDRNDVPAPEPETDAAMYRYELDPQGFARKVLFLSDRGSPRAVQGAYGYDVKCDARGQEEELTFLGADGRPAVRKDGIERARFEHDALGHTTESAYFGADGARALMSRGFSIVRTRFDDAGNPIEVSYLGVDERPVLAKLGYATMRSRFDAQGNEIERSFFGTSGALILTRTGFAMSRSTFDARGNEMERAHFGVSGEPVTMSQGFSVWRTKYDARGRDVERAFFGTDQKPVLNIGGYAKLTTVYDERGNEIERSSFGTDDKPIVLKAGRAISRFKYDERGNQIEAAYFGADGAPIVAKDGCARWKYGFDDRGHVVSRECFGVDGRPLASADGCAAWRISYDELGHAILRACSGADGAPALEKEGFAAVRSSFDERGDEIEKTYLGVLGRASAGSTGFAIWRGRHDERGRLIEEAYFDVAGNPTKRREGYALRRIARDERGNEIEKTFFDEAGAPVLSVDGVSSVRSTFDESDNETERAFSGLHGEPVMDRHGCARWRSKFDARKNEIERACIGVEGDPALTKEGYARWRATFDDRSTLVEKTYLDLADRGVPAPPAESPSKSD